MTTPKVPKCYKCEHFLERESVIDLKCKAFPAGIPEKIWLSQVEHDKPFPGDNGIQFEPKKGE